MMITASSLRENIYKVLDSVLETGIAVEINRKGRILKIVSQKGISKLAHIKKHDILKGNPESIVHIDWSGEWKA